jgi:putative flavoprotein involved in K+ transport
MTTDVDTLVVGAGQAGLATSYCLTNAGVEHLVVDRQDHLGSAWANRWDSFCLVTPNFSLQLPGFAYYGPDPESFMPRDDVMKYIESYAASFHPPVELNTGIRRLVGTDGRFEAQTDGGVTITARNVVLATGPYHRPKIPAAADQLPGRVQQLHSHGYRRPEQLADGAVLVVGTGQSGVQIAEELHEAGRDVHLAVSMCLGAPRRYRGRDVIWWLVELLQNGDRVGVSLPTVQQLPSPAARFGCVPHATGKNGGHDINLRQFARQGIELYGGLMSVSGSTAHFSADLQERLVFAETRFDQTFRPLFDAYDVAAGVDAPRDDRPTPDTFTPPTRTELDLDAAGIRSVVWCTGYRLDYGWVDLPVFDEWGYPLHERGVTTHPGLYAVGLPWLHRQPSAAFAGVGADAAHVVDHIASRAGRAA